MFSPFFYTKLTSPAFDYNSIKKWIKVKDQVNLEKSKISSLKVNIFQFRKVLIPINSNFHWSLISVSPTCSEIEYFDSLAGDENILMQVN